MFALEASVDTFHAFTKTVEALALQESVIGNVVSTCFMCIVKNVKLVNAWLKCLCETSLLQLVMSATIRNVFTFALL